MVKTFEPQDEEFAVSTGSNVNSGAGTSTFDYPPNGTSNLIVTSKPGDPDPKTFEPGDVYDISWSGTGGGGVIENAVVIRSDAAPDGAGGAIVFEGTDENGDLVHVVWAPDVDLETWYWDHFDSGQSPEFWTSDQDPAYSHSVVCFDARMRILTADCWKPAGQIRAGMRVWTRDAGYQTVLWAGGKTVPGRGRNTPVRFATDTIGNTAPLLLSQQHRVLLRSPRAELMFASHEVLVPAKVFVGQPGIGYAPCAEVTYVHLMTEHHHLLRAEGAECESLFLGDEADTILRNDLAGVPGLSALRRTHNAARPILTFREAAGLLGTCHPRQPCEAF